MVCVSIQRQHNLPGQSKDIVCQENMRDIIGAFGIALLANIAVLVVAASTFHNVGLVILTLQDAHALMEQVTFVLSFVINCNISNVITTPACIFTCIIYFRRFVVCFLVAYLSEWLWSWYRF